MNDLDQRIGYAAKWVHDANDIQEYLIADSILATLIDESVDRMLYPPIPARRWPFLRRVVKVRRALRHITTALGFLLRVTAFYLCVVGLLSLLRHPTPAFTALLLTGAATLTAEFVEIITMMRERIGADE